MSTPVCRKHPHQKLICPLCRSAKGGSTTAKRHTKKQLAAWGKLGGRPRKQKPEDAKTQTEVK